MCSDIVQFDSNENSTEVSLPVNCNGKRLVFHYGYRSIDIKPESDQRATSIQQSHAVRGVFAQHTSLHWTCRSPPILAGDDSY